MKMARREAPSRFAGPPARAPLEECYPMQNWPLRKSAIRTGFGRQPPLWKERRKKAGSRFLLRRTKVGNRLYDTPAPVINLVNPNSRHYSGWRFFMPEKKVRTVVHNGRRRSTGEAYSPKHNSRSGGIGDHVLANPERKNIYITLDFDGNPTMHEQVDFEKHEREFSISGGAERAIPEERQQGPYSDNGRVSRGAPTRGDYTAGRQYEYDGATGSHPDCGRKVDRPNACQIRLSV